LIPFLPCTNFYTGFYHRADICPVIKKLYVD